MADNKQLQLALELATMAHKNVTRRNGDPYIFHPLRVSSNKTFIKTKLQKAVALLHDVIEDTPLTFLTHDKENVKYEDYIANICNNLDAMMVKLSDLTDNLDQGTLPVISDKDRERFIVYENAKVKIMSTLAENYPEEFKEIMNHR